MGDWLPSWFPGRDDPEREPEDPGRPDIVEIEGQEGRWHILQRSPASSFVEVVDMLQLWQRDRFAVSVFSADLYGESLQSWSMTIRTITAPPSATMAGTYEIHITELPKTRWQRDRTFVGVTGGLRYVVTTTAITGFVCSFDVISAENFVVNSLSARAISLLEALGGIEEFQARLDSPAEDEPLVFITVEPVHEARPSPRRGPSPRRRPSPVGAPAGQLPLCAEPQCNKMATGVCDACRCAVYCGKACQERDWNHGTHQDVCVKRT